MFGRRSKWKDMAPRGGRTSGEGGSDSLAGGLDSVPELECGGHAGVPALRSASRDSCTTETGCVARAILEGVR